MNSWLDLRNQVGRRVIRFGEAITRLGNRIQAPGCWTGDKELAWREGYDFGRDQIAVTTERNAT